MKMTAQEYARRVRRIGPHSPLGLDCLWAFGVGGGICLLGEVLRQSYLAMGVEADLAGTLTSCSLIVLSAVLTTLGWYQKLAAKAGAGSLVPITGFANAVVSAAIEFKAEGRVLGTGAKMFTIAGPVIVYGTLAAVVYGAVRTPTAQWTATAAGCCLLQPQGEGVGIAAATFGRVQDYQVKDINNMGAAMAPAAASTLLHYFKDTGTEPQEFDCIYTGDLGQVGSQLLRELLAAEGLLIKNHVDCGCILFDANEQSVKSGGSGPGCCAAVLCGHILPRLRRGSQKRVLFTATGALMSQTIFLQKETIPAVAHLVELRAPEKEK